jgi:hypothetical protein
MTNLQAQKIEWLQEQFEVASQVIVEEAQFESTFDGTAGGLDRFSRIPLDLAQENNLAGGQYYGGADVCFPEDEGNNDAVAVYVVVDAPWMWCTLTQSISV